MQHPIPLRYPIVVGITRPQTGAKPYYASSKLLKVLPNQYCDVAMERWGFQRRVFGFVVEQPQIPSMKHIVGWRLQVICGCFFFQSFHDGCLGFKYETLLHSLCFFLLTFKLFFLTNSCNIVYGFVISKLWEGYNSRSSAIVQPCGSHCI